MKDNTSKKPSNIHSDGIMVLSYKRRQLPRRQSACHGRTWWRKMFGSSVRTKFEGLNLKDFCTISNHTWGDVIWTENAETLNQSNVSRSNLDTWVCHLYFWLAKKNRSDSSFISIPWLRAALIGRRLGSVWTVHDSHRFVDRREKPVPKVVIVFFLLHRWIQDLIRYTVNI